MVFHIYWQQEGIFKEYGKTFEGFPQMVKMLGVCRELQRLGGQGGENAVVHLSEELATKRSQSAL